MFKPGDFNPNAVVQTFLSDLDDLAVPPRKRRKLGFGSSPSIADLDTEVLASTMDFSALQKTYHPHLLQTLHKWSAKIHAVTPQALLPSSRNKFAAASKPKSTVDLIQETLADHGKVLGRTRILRSASTKRIGVEGEGVTIGGDLDVEGRAIEREDIEVFDDTDFYQQLLRDVIDGRSGGDANGTSIAFSQANNSVWR
jgi:protein AATF/BFR2